MQKKEPYFELDYTSGKVRVQSVSMNGAIVYRVVFSDRRAPLTVVQATRHTGEPFWTSLPEGRQREAEEVGVLISEYYKNQH